MPFNITLVRSRIKSRPYAKLDGAYSGPTWNNNIGLQTVPDDPGEVFKLLRVLSEKSDTCMVMGTAIRPEIMDTDRTMRNFEEKPVSMVVFDLDKYESPNMIKRGKSITYPQVLEDAKGFVREYLPPEFHDTTFIIRFSSSFLVSPKPQLRAHLVFVLEEPQYPREIGMWIRHERVPVDSTFYFNLTQPIFTAAPVWDRLVDPLQLRDPKIPRIGIATGGNPRVPKGWQPYSFHKYAEKLDVSALPTASQLPGKMGSFCRMVPVSKILQYLGYTSEDEQRYLAPESSTGLAGAMVFENGFVYSHHDKDPINRVVEEVFNFKRRSLNAYDLMHGWAKLHREDIEIMKEFDFLLEQAVLNDTSYQEEMLHTLVTRADWLDDGGYEGLNRKIIDGIVVDMHHMGLTNTTREYVFGVIKSSAPKIRLTDLRSLWKNVRKDKALQRDEYDPESNLRHMANIFKRQRIIYSHHKTATGDFWCYFGDTRVWKRCNHTQARAFIYNHIHSSMPLKVEIDFTKMEHLTTLILRETCLSMSNFKKGLGWAFRGGKYCIDMHGLFVDPEWNVDSNVRTLRKEDHIHKELPITYKEWLSEDGAPEEYIDFLVSSFEEDMESIEMVREFGGYILADSYFIHKMLILEGVPGSGKSILAKVFQEMIGSQYYAAVSIIRVSGQFGLGDLPGKKLAVMSEARQVDMGALRALVPILLKIVGQDYIDTEAKHKSSMTELLECKIVILTNRTPVIPDDTGALTQRLLMARLDKCFRDTEEEILGLDTLIIQRGLTSIIKWHLKGLENLNKRKAFIEPEKGVAAKRWLSEQIDPLKTYLDNFFTLDMDYTPEKYILQPDFIRYFRAFLRRIGQSTDDTQDKVRKRASIRNVKSLYPKVSVQRRWEHDRRQYYMNGLVPRMDMDMEFVTELSELE